MLTCADMSWHTKQVWSTSQQHGLIMEADESITDIQWVVFTCGQSQPCFPCFGRSMFRRVYRHYKLAADILTRLTGSSNGRGPRCASWFLQYVREHAGDKNMQVMTLEGKQPYLDPYLKDNADSPLSRRCQRLGQGRTAIHEANGRLR